MRWRVPPADIGIELCRVGAVSVWALIEDVVMIFGGPRTGKTGWIAGRILDAAGAVLVTSTRTDLLELCGPLRAAKGPVFVFNPVGLGGLASTITFDPLTGCTNPRTASERAADLIAAVTRASSGGDREFWNTHARRILTVLLHAAALGGKSMHDVGRWLGNEAAMGKEVPALLRRSPVPAFEQELAQFLATNPNTRTSISSTVAPALNWLNDGDAVKAAERGVGFDVAQLLADRATVFLLGGEETQTAPLVCALTGHIAREARRLAALSPKGRLDPHLTLALDEAALISPVRLESWTADMGGRGVTIIAAFQSRAQLLARWGEHATATILNNTAAVMVFGGTRDRDDLNFWSTLAGERDEPTLTTDMHGRLASKSTRRVPVLPPAQLANLPAGRVLLVRRGIPPVIGRVVMAWHRRDVRDLAFHRDHPVAAARIGRARARMLRPVRTSAAAVHRATAAASTSTTTTVRGATATLRAQFAGGWRWLTGAPAPDPAAPGREPATVELLLITDGLALVAYAATARLHGSGARYAWSVVVLAAGLSGLAQAAFFASGSAVDASPALRFGVGAWPAVAAAIVAHLLYLLATDADDHRHPQTGTTEAPQRSVQSEVFSPDAVQSVQPLNDTPVTRPGVQRPTAVQPTATRPELPAGPVEHPRSGPGPTPARDRARAAATRHAHRHGALPTVTDLAGIAEVSRGTAAAALRTLRAQPTPLHLINTTEQADPASPETRTQS